MLPMSTISDAPAGSALCIVEEREEASRQVAPDTEDEPSSFDPGHRLGRYLIIGRLRSDSLGHLYRARDGEFGMPVTIREFLPRGLVRRSSGFAVSARSPEASTRFESALSSFIREQLHVAALGRMPFVAATLEVISANGTAYVIQDSPPGETLGRRLANGSALCATELDALVGALVGGLEAVHRANMLHAGIGPEDIVLREGAMPVLTGLLASAEAISNWPAETGLGASYLAPERIEGGACGPWTDVYALAATLFHAAAQCAPLTVAARGGAGKRTAVNDLPAEPSPSRLRSAIQAGLELSPADRPQSIGEWRDLIFGQQPIKGPVRDPARRFLMQRLAILSALVVAGGPLAYLGATSGLGRGIAASLAAETSQSPGGAYRVASARTHRSAESSERRLHAVVDSVEKEMRQRDLAQSKAKAEAVRAAAESVRRDISALEGTILAGLEEAAEADKLREEQAQAQAEADENRAADVQEAEERLKIEHDIAGAAATEAALNLDGFERQHIQAALKFIGFDPVWIDGVFGPRSRAMIAAWQTDHDLAVTGYLSSAQYLTLLSEGATGIADYDGHGASP